MSKCNKGNDRDIPACEYNFNKYEDIDLWLHFEQINQEQYKELKQHIDAGASVYKTRSGSIRIEYKGEL